MAAYDFPNAPATGETTIGASGEVYQWDGVKWVSIATPGTGGGGGGGGTKSPLTTKGDIWVYSTTDTRLPVGSNGQILAANSAQTTGLNWIAPPSGGSSGVSSFNNRTGAVAPAATDYPPAFIGAVNATGSYTNPSWIVSLPWSKITGAPAITPPPVTTVFGRTGAITAVSTDYASFYASLNGTYYDPAWITGLSYSKLIGAPTIPPAYTLPVATASVLGGVKQGANVSIAGDGTLSATSGAYTLPVATVNILGGVKQGANVTIAGDGTLSAFGGTGGGMPQTPWASNIVGAGYNLTQVNNIQVGGSWGTQHAGCIAMVASAPADYVNVTINNTSPTGFSAVIMDADVSQASITFNGSGTSAPSALTIQNTSSTGPIVFNGYRVGVGVNSPAYKLDVAGDVNIGAGNVYRVGGVPLVSGYWTAGTGGVIYYNGGNVGIGTATPAALLTLSKNAAALQAPSADTMAQFANVDGTPTRLMLDTYGAAGNLTFRTAGGTAAAPTAVAANQQLGGVAGWGRGATGYSTGRAVMNFYAAENWTDAAQGAFIAFNTTPTGASVSIERVRIDSTGNVGVAVTAPAYKVDVSGDCNITGVYRINGVPLVTGGGGSNYWVGGTAGAIYYSGGNVGVGTATPAQLLHVKGSGNSYIRVDSGGAANDAAVTCYDGTTAASSGLMAASGGGAGNWVVFNGGIRLAVTPTGSVGIGVTAPANMFHVVNPTAPPTSGFAQTNVTFGPAAGPGTMDFLALSTNSGANAYCDIGANVYFDFATATWKLRNTGVDAWAIGLQPSSSPTSSTMNFMHAPATTGAVALTSFMVIVPSGNVGIGTPTPVCLLDIPGLASTTNSQMRVGAIEMQTYGVSNDFITSNLYYNANWIYRNTGFGAVMQMNGGGFSFLTAPSGNAGATATAIAGAMYILNSGRVGIGVSPANIFQVSDRANHSLGITGPVSVSGAACINAVNDPWNANIPLEIRATATTVSIGPLSVGIGGSWSSGSFNVVGGRSYIYANGEPYAFGLAYQPSSTQGMYIGTNSNNQFQVSNNAGGWVCIIDGSGNTSLGGNINLYNNVIINNGAQQYSINIISSASDPGVSINNQNTSGRTWQMLSSGGGSGLGAGNFSIYDASAGSPRLTITPGGFVGLNVVSPTNQLTLIPFSNPSNFTTTLQMALGENSNNTAYRLYLGFLVNAGYWAGAVNAIAGGAGTHLYLNPSGAYIRTGNASVPAYNMDIAGDCNVTGTYRINGTPIATSGAPTTMVSAAPYYCTPTGARGFQTTYTNNTGGPVWVVVQLSMPNAFSVAGAALNAGSIYLAQATSSTSATMVLFFVVLPGQGYYLNPGGTWPTIANVLEYK